MTPSSNHATEKVRWKSHWGEVARAVKRAIVSRREATFVGKQYRLAYETRHVRERVDYRFLKECARDKQCVMDVGANVGVTSLIMSDAIAGGGKIYAIEPSEASCLIVRENVLLNNVGNSIEVINAIVAERSGLPIEYHWDLVSSRASIMMEPPSGMSIPLSKVSVSLDDLVESLEIRPDLIKIDVEGAEGRVIGGLGRVLQEIRPMTIVELHAWQGMTIAQNAAGILENAQAANYRMTDLRTKKVVEDPAVFGDLAASTDQVQSRVWVLLLPEEMPMPGWIEEFDTVNL